MRVFCYRNASDANRLEILYKEASDAWQIVRLVGSVGAVATGPAQSFAANSHHTVVGTWDSGSVKISSDAGAFVSASSGNVPSLPNSVFEIGNRDDGLRAVKAACYWVAIGSGVTLTDTDVSGLNGFGDTDPTWDTLPAGRKLLWTADDPTYLDAAPPATVIRPRTIRAVRQIPARF